MSKYEVENVYIDEDDRRPRLLLMLGIIILIVIILVIVISCGMKGKSSNANLSALRISSGELSPKFDKTVTSYTASPNSNFVTVYCTGESIKAKTSGCNRGIDLNDGTTHKIVVTAEDNSKKEYIINFIKPKDGTKVTKEETNTKENSDTKVASEIGLEKVVINSSVTSGKETNKTIVLTAVLTPTNSNAKYIWYKDGVEINGATKDKYEVTTSGIYYVRVTYGNIVKESEVYRAKIVNANTKSVTSNLGSKTTKSTTKTTTTVTPKINSITGNPSSWVTAATLKVNASNAKYYSFDGGKNYQSSNTKTITKNGTYTVVVKSSSGKTVSKQVTINKIDSTKPTVTISTSSKTDKSVILTAKVNPTSNTSGYKYQWYMNDKVIVGATKESYKASATATYKVKVTTGSGSVVYSTGYKFEKVMVTCPTLSASTASGKNVQPYTWYGEYVYVKIVPSPETVSYDVYMNEDGIYDSISRHFKYLDTFKGNVKVRIVNGGQRLLKIVVKDSSGNTNTCYSHAYYLR